MRLFGALDSKNPVGDVGFCTWTQCLEAWILAADLFSQNMKDGHTQDILKSQIRSDRAARPTKVFTGGRSVYFWGNSVNHRAVRKVAPKQLPVRSQGLTSPVKKMGDDMATWFASLLNTSGLENGPCCRPWHKRKLGTVVATHGFNQLRGKTSSWNWWA